MLFCQLTGSGRRGHPLPRERARGLRGRSGGFIPPRGGIRRPTWRHKAATYRLTATIRTIKITAPKTIQVTGPGFFFTFNTWS